MFEQHEAKTRESQAQSHPDTHEFRTQAAFVWRHILRTDPSDFLDTEQCSLLLGRRGTRDDLAQPGFVGRNYRPGGLLFVSMNPGNGGDGNTKGDLEQYEALEALKCSSDEEILRAFERLTDVLNSFMLTWDITRNIVGRVLSLGALDLSDAAYIDLFKWRTVKGANLSDLYGAAWANHVREQLHLLQPELIVALGSSAGSSLQKLRCLIGTVMTVRRHFSRLRPNNQDGERDIATIGSWLRDRSMLQRRGSTSTSNAGGFGLNGVRIPSC